MSRTKSAAKKVIAAKAPRGVACTDFAGTHAVDELIHAADRAERELAVATIKTVVEPFVDSIASADLNAVDAKNIVAVVNNSHILCSLCAAAIHVMTRLRRLMSDSAVAVSAKVMASVRENVPLSDEVNAALEVALARTFEALAQLMVDPAKLTMLRLVGLISCPDVSEHPEVYRHCVRPLTKVFVTEAMAEWVGNGFPEDAPMLQQRLAPNGR